MGRVVVSLAVGAILAALAVAAIGCGGSSSDEPELTKAAFIKRGDQICAKAETKKERDTAAEYVRVTKGKKTNQLDQATMERLVLDFAMPPLTQMAEELDDLGAPDDQADAIVTAFLETAADVEDDPAPILSGNNPFSKPSALAASYGFKACSQI